MTGSTPPPQPSNRVLDTEALKGLAHPLRAQLYEVLSTYGPATASGLAERLGESSGATSYHLRQLERHGFVREVEDRGTGRERWWERVPGGVSVSALDFPPNSAGREASRRVSNEWERNRAEQLRAFGERGIEFLEPEWLEASELSTSNLRLTLEELTELQTRLSAVYMELVEEFRGRNAPGSRPVQVHLNIFPIVDGQPTEGSE